MTKRFTLLLFLFFILIPGKEAACQKDSTKVIKQSSKRVIVFSSQGLLAIGSLAYLQNTWYSNFNTGKFRTIDDSGQWLQMDKIGHMATVNMVSNVNYQAYSWAGYSNKQATWMGFGLTWSYLTAIEIMDGYSEGWGFSWSDIAANTIGGALFVAQQLTWEEQRILMKFSYHATEYAAMRPEVLGSTSAQRILKDYNGQTYWLSVNPQSFFKERKVFPKWLNLALGYSADGLLGGKSNVGDDYDFSDIPRIRQFYFSPDIDFSRITTKSKFLKGLFVVLNMIKVPAPTLEVDQNGDVKFYFFYF